MPESGATPQISKIRRGLLKGARALTTPLVPDDYIELVNPLVVDARASGDRDAGAPRDG